MTGVERTALAPIEFVCMPLIGPLIVTNGTLARARRASLSIAILACSCLLVRVSVLRTVIVLFAAFLCRVLCLGRIEHIAN